MSASEILKSLLDAVDTTLGSLEPIEAEPDTKVRDVLAQRAARNMPLEQAIDLTTAGLEQFPLNSGLLRRRSWALAEIVTPDGEYTQIQAAFRDLQAILATEPDNFRAALDLLQMTFTFSELEDERVAKMAAGLAGQAESVMLEFRRLQIEALVYAGELDEARELHAWLSEVFPGSSELRRAAQAIDEMTP